MEALLALGIEAVVELASEEPRGTFPRGLIHVRFPLVDGPGNPTWLLRLAVETTARLVIEDVPTFLYCGAGMSRTPAIAAMAIAWIEGRSPDACLAEVLNGRRGDISPGLWAELRSISMTLGG